MAKNLELMVCRGTVAFVWFYHGLFPKLLGPHKDELAMTAGLGVAPATAIVIAQIGGIGELLLAGAILLLWRREWPLVLSCALMAALLCFAAFSVPEMLSAAFNPVSTNLAVFALGWVALRLHRTDNSQPA
jgi:hypothetical protein